MGNTPAVQEQNGVNAYRETTNMDQMSKLSVSRVQIIIDHTSTVKSQMLLIFNSEDQLKSANQECKFRRTPCPHLLQSDTRSQLNKKQKFFPIQDQQICQTHIQSNLTKKEVSRLSNSDANILLISGEKNAVLPSSISHSAVKEEQITLSKRNQDPQKPTQEQKFLLKSNQISQNHVCSDLSPQISPKQKGISGIERKKYPNHIRLQLSQIPEQQAEDLCINVLFMSSRWIVHLFENQTDKVPKHKEQN